jgi:hypothetical protein
MTKAPGHGKLLVGYRHDLGLNAGVLAGLAPHPTRHS